MYLLAKFGDHRSYRNGDINSYINSYTKKAGEKAEVTASIRHIARFLISGTPIYNPEVPNKVGRKTKREGTQANAKHFVSNVNAIQLMYINILNRGLITL